MLDTKPKRLLGLTLMFALGGCASGSSHVQTLFKQVHPLDAVAVGAVGAAAYAAAESDAGWNARVLPNGERRYRITVSRLPGHGNGEGEFPLRFSREIHRVVADRGCSGYRVLAYQERHETRLFYSSRIAEGEIECL